MAINSDGLQVPPAMCGFPLVKSARVSSKALAKDESAVTN
jgi:hypothetical protein